MSISDLSDVFFFPNDVIAQSIIENVREIKLKGMYDGKLSHELETLAPIL